MGFCKNYSTDEMLCMGGTQGRLMSHSGFISGDGSRGKVIGTFNIAFSHILSISTAFMWRKNCFVDV